MHHPAAQLHTATVDQPAGVRDRYGRTIDYLRVSVIDHCNLRCVYCMPLSGSPHAASRNLLTPGEIERVVRAAAGLGFRKIRVTGGEPTLRADLVEIVERIAGVDGIADVSLTTNGVLLPRMIDDLVSAGLTRVNLHIDSLNPERYRRVMRLGSLADARRGLEAVVRAGLFPIKINCVVTRGYNEADVVELAGFDPRPGLPRALHRAHAAGGRRMRPHCPRSVRADGGDPGPYRSGAWAASGAAVLPRER
jgi:cyclic pyranopterin phosphate synthase